MDELSFNEESSELSSDNKKVSSDKEAALLGPLQPALKQTQLFKSSDVSLDNAAALLQSISSPKGCLYCGEPPDHTTVWSG